MAPSRRRVSWMVRHLGLSKTEHPPDRRGFVALQIDARGILEGGSSYCNMFSGDAAQSTLTLSTLGQRQRSPLGWLDLFIFTLLFVPLLLRIFALSVWETLLEVYDHLLAQQTGRPQRD